MKKNIPFAQFPFFLFPILNGEECLMMSGEPAFALRRIYDDAEHWAPALIALCFLPSLPPCEQMWKWMVILILLITMLVLVLVLGRGRDKW